MGGDADFGRRQKDRRGARRVRRRIRHRRFGDGVTAPDRELARRAEEQGADYVGFCPVFLTRSKANPTSVKGVGGLQKFCGSVSLPVIAIAGITVDRTAEVLEAGAHGIAVMTAISLAQYPEIETQKFSLALMGQHD